MPQPTTRRPRRAIWFVTPLLVARGLVAQAWPCGGFNGVAGSSLGPLCVTGVEAAKIFQPLWGVSTSGGNPHLGTAGTLGRLGRVSVTARVNATAGSLPDPAGASSSPVPGRSSGVFPTTLVEGAVGLWQGTGAGFLSLDALGTAVFFLGGAVTDLGRSPGSPHVLGGLVGVGYGARVGVHQGPGGFPSLSVSYMRRTLPRVQYGSPPPTCCTGDQFEFDLDLRADAYRFTTGWRFPAVDVAAGIGIDHYSSRVHLHTHLGSSIGSVSFDVPFGLSMTRQLLFADAGIRFAGAKLVGELGYEPGKDDHLTTPFAGFDPTAGHPFGSLGLRFGI
jgi:hypothetical protein